jgi:hypothetical protein
VQKYKRNEENQEGTTREIKNIREYEPSKMYDIMINDKNINKSVLFYL